MLSKFKNKLKTYEAKNRQKIKNSQPQLKIYWFLKKMGQHMYIIFLSNVDYSVNNLHILSLSRQRTIQLLLKL